MSVDKGGEHVEVLALCLDEVSLESPVQAFDVLGNVTDHSHPVVLLVGVDLPALIGHIAASLG